MRRTIILVTLATAISLATADLAAAKGRYARGQALFRRHCASCLSMGWTWAPTPPDPRKPLDLAKMASSLPAYRVCVFQHRQTRSGLKGPACYPGRISTRDRLDILYYLYRRSMGDFRPPRPRALRAPLYKGGALRRTLAARRRTALARYKNLLLLRKMRAKVRAMPWRWLRRPGPRAVHRRSLTPKVGR